MRVTAILLAAGSGRRFRGNAPKLLVRIGGKPVLFYSLNTLSRHPAVNEIVLVTNPAYRQSFARLIKEHGLGGKVKCLVAGGERRQDSVLNGLRQCGDSDIVLVHDAARPFAKKELITAVIKGAKKYGACVPGVKVKPTIREVNSKGFSAGTIERSVLREIHTPQAFKRRLLAEAFKRFAGHDATDEAVLIEKMKKPVKIFESSYSNIKLTTREDVFAAEAILRAAKGKA